MKQHKINVIDNYLQDIWFYIWNKDWEYSEPAYEAVLEEIYEAIESDKPDNIVIYIKDYIKENYPFNK